MKIRKIFFLKNVQLLQKFYILNMQEKIQTIYKEILKNENTKQKGIFAACTAGSSLILRFFYKKRISRNENRIRNY